MGETVAEGGRASREGELRPIGHSQMKLGNEFKEPKKHRSRLQGPRCVSKTGKTNLESRAPIVEFAIMPEGTSNSVINLGDIAKPADTLIKKISNAVGTLYEPTHIKRVAQANADAAIIEAKGNLEITELQRRALNRFVEEEGKRQSNIEEITDKALPQLKDSAKPEKVDDDWITNFFDKCRIISDHEMQELWARILAGEANTPGSYSKRTVNFLADLDKMDATLFSSLLGFASEHLGGMFPLVFEPTDAIYKGQGITVQSLCHLDTIGLITFSAVGSYGISDMPDESVMIYYGRILQMPVSQKDGKGWDVGHVLLTSSGQELAAISPKEEVAGFFDYVKEQWQKPVTSKVLANIEDMVETIKSKADDSLRRISSAKTAG